MDSRKKKLITIAIIVAVIVGLLAYLNYIPFWASITSAASFIIGIILGWKAKEWKDDHVN